MVIELADAYSTATQFSSSSESDDLPLGSLNSHAPDPEGISAATSSVTVEAGGPVTAADNS
jgi:hypothetical protein